MTGNQRAVILSEVEGRCVVVIVYETMPVRRAVIPISNRNLWEGCHAQIHNQVVNDCLPHHVQHGEVTIVIAILSLQ